MAKQNKKVDKSIKIQNKKSQKSKIKWKRLKNKKDKKNVKQNGLDSKNLSKNVINKVKKDLNDNKEKNSEKKLLNSDNISDFYSPNWEKYKNLVHSNSKENTKVNAKKVLQNDKKIVSQNPMDQLVRTLKPNYSDFVVTKQHLVQKFIKTNSFGQLIPQFELKPEQSPELTRAVSIDCEMVGTGFKGRESTVARVSIVNEFGHVLLNSYVKPMEDIRDYRTQFSGIRPENMEKAVPFLDILFDVDKILKGRVIIGHALDNDLLVLRLKHAHHMIRDTSKFTTFRQVVKGGTPGLKVLSRAIMGVEIQGAEHDSVQDARAAMCLYLLYKEDWEKIIKHNAREIRNVRFATKKKKTKKNDIDLNSKES